MADLTVSAAMQAARISAESGLPLADSVIVAAARSHDAVIWTQDSDFKNIEKVKYRGKRK